MQAPAAVAVATPAIPLVWTRLADAEVRVDSAQVRRVARAFTALEVLSEDSATYYVRCATCAPVVEGRIGRAAVVAAAPPLLQARQAELSVFLLALRRAAAARDVTSLRGVLSPRFVSSLDGGDGLVETFARWEREAYRSVDRLPRLLDQGVASEDGTLWVAPPEYLTETRYPGLRAGFRRGEAGWEWLFLVGR